MSREQSIKDLEELLDTLRETKAKNDRVTFGAVLDQIGRRSFGPLVLLAGLITSAPIIGDIPGVPTLIAALLILVGVQLLFRKKHIWLPQWLLRRSVSRDKYEKTLAWMRKPARFIDRFLRPRLTFLTRRTGTIIIGLVCLLIAALLPPMEFIPFSANGAGAALTAFGLALVVHNGLLAIIAFAITLTTLILITHHLSLSLL